MTEPIYPTKPRPGDRVAILSSAAGLPGILPLPFDLGLRRLVDDFGLVPVEYPTTRTMNADPRDRAADLHAAFGDDSIAAVISSIGGDDEITVLKHLDPELLRANPKPYFGASDDTNLHALLSSVGIVSYYGGCVMTSFGRPGTMHPLTAESLHAALLGGGEYRLRPATEYTDMGRDWADPATFDSAPDMFPADGWIWRNADRPAVTGRTWGGCLEIVAWLAMADLMMPEPSEFDGAVLFLETSEEMPSDAEVYRTLRNFGERGILERCGAFLFARPKAWDFGNRTDAAGRADYVRGQYAAINRALDEYAPDTPAAFNVDFGHTDPDLILPFGGSATVDGPTGEITVRY